MTLTNRKIGRLSAVDGKRVSISVGDGLTIRVHPSGRKSWVFRRYRDGRVIDETIGYWPEMSLKHARQAVREKRKRAALEPPAGFTLRDAFRLWCAVKDYRQALRNIPQQAGFPTDIQWPAFPSGLGVSL